MSKKQAFRPEWSWWVRSGERLRLGIDVRLVLEGGGGLAAARQSVEAGSGVVAALRAAGVELPQEAWCLLEAGEYAGRLGEAMCETGELLRERERRRRELAGQLWYPAVVLLTAFLVMALILLWVVPQLRGISEAMGMGARLPWLTEHIGVLYGAAFGLAAGTLALAAAAAALLRRLGRDSPGWARAGEAAWAALPGLGRQRAQLREARVLRQVGTLLRAGVTLAEALDMAARSAPGRYEHDQLLEFRRRLLMGSGFAEGLRSFRIVAVENASLLLAGQESGQLDTYMERLARELDEQAVWRLRQWTRLLEPLMLLGLSVAIGGLLLAYLLPMVRMLEQLA